MTDDLFKVIGFTKDDPSINFSDCKSLFDYIRYAADRMMSYTNKITIAGLLYLSFNTVLRFFVKEDNIVVEYITTTSKFGGTIIEKVFSKMFSNYKENMDS